MSGFYKKRDGVFFLKEKYTKKLCDLRYLFFADLEKNDI